MALALWFGGICDCGGEIYEVRVGRPSIIGPGRHVGWKCKSCSKEYSFLTPPAEQEKMREQMQPLMDKISKRRKNR